MMFRSLRANLNLGLLLSMVVLAMALWVLVGLAVKNITTEYIETRLEHDAETVLVAANVNQAGRITIDQQQIQNIYHRPFSGHYYFLKSGSGQTLYSRSLWDEQLNIENLPARGSIELARQDGPRDQQLLVRARWYQKQGEALLIVTAEDVSHVAEQMAVFQWRFGLAILVIVVLLLLAQSWIIRLGMRPVKQTALAIKQLEAGETNKLPEAVPEEVLPLVREVNHLLEQQQQRLQRSRLAMGDLAHAIKTPLALVMQWYESLDAAEQSRHETVLRQVKQIQQRIDNELKRARMAGDQRGRSRFNLQKDLPPLLDTLQRLHSQSDVHCDLHYETGLILPLEQEDATELLGNLLDNAWKWADTAIRLSFEKQDGQLLIVIDDDGPGIEPDQVEHLLQRGRRADESVSGHGIGLSIVKQIVESYQGTLQLERSEQLGGLRVVVELPLSNEVNG